MTDDEWRGRTDKRLGHIEERIGAMELKDAVAAVHHSNVEKRLTSIEGTLVWLTRLIIGALIMAVIGFALSGGFQP